MNRFSPVSEEIIQSREVEWSVYAGEPVRMRHGFYLRLRPGCSYSKKRFIYRVTEAAEIDFFLRIFRRKTDSQNFIDIGANIGYWTKVMSGLNPRVNVHSYEPDKVTFDILKSNVADLQNVKIYNLGIGREVGERALFYDPADSGDSSLVPNSERASYQVGITSLDAHAEVLQLERIDFVKVDIQGGETDFFLGATKTIIRDRPIMLVEVMSLLNPSLVDYISFFAIRMHYTIFIISNGMVSLTAKEDFSKVRDDVNVFLVPEEEKYLVAPEKFVFRRDLVVG